MTDSIKSKFEDWYLSMPDADESLLKMKNEFQYEEGLIDAMLISFMAGYSIRNYSYLISIDNE